MTPISGGRTDRLVARLGPLDGLLLPVRLLDAIGTLAEPVLQGDPAAIERMRRLIGVSAGVALANPESVEAAVRGPDTRTEDGGLLHLGVLVATAFAAGRVGAPLGLAGAFAGVVFGLARAATPVELLLRALDAGGSDQELRALLDAVLAGGLAGQRLVPALVADPVALARWRRVGALAASVSKLVDGTWEGTVSAPVRSLSPRSACPEQPGEVWIDADLPDVPSVVVGAVVVPARVVELGIAADLPAGVRPGWLGLTTPALRAAARAHRLRLVEAARGWSADELRAEPVPVEWIAVPADGVIEPPQRWPTARLDSDLPVIDAAFTPARIGPGEAAVLRWSVRGADGVTLEPGGDAPASGERTVTEPGTVRIVASSACAPVERVVTLERRSRIVAISPPPGPVPAGRPLALEVTLDPPAEVELQLAIGSAPPIAGLVVPADRVRGELSGRVIAVGHDAAPFGPYVATDRLPARVVAVRPAARAGGFARAGAAEVAKWLGPSGFEPVWVDDEVVSPVPEPDGPDSPGVGRLLAALDRQAARSPGFEDAVWLAVLPRSSTPFAAVAPGAACAAVGVVTLGAQWTPGVPRVRDVARRLRVVGELGADGGVRVIEVVDEVRASGPGPEVDTDAVLILRDASGAELGRHPIRVHERGAPTPFVAVVASAPEVDAIEVRRPGGSARVGRTVGRPTLSAAAVDDGHLRWTWAHERGAPPTLWVEAVARGGAVRVAALPPCESVVSLPVLRDAAEWRVVGSDGFNTVTAPVGPGAPRVVPYVRAVPGTRTLWADLPDGATGPRWSAGGAEADGPLFTVPAGARAVTLEATVDGRVVVGRRALEQPQPVAWRIR